MGNKCCVKNRGDNIYDIIDYLEKEENQIRKQLETDNKLIKTETRIM